MPQTQTYTKYPSGILEQNCGSNNYRTPVWLKCRITGEGAVNRIATCSYAETGIAAAFALLSE